MSTRYRCRVEGARVRREQQETLDALIRKMFERRHHGYVAGREKAWLAAELVQSLREASRIYREELSTETDGLLPFALGYFRLREGALELISDRIPANVEPKPFVLFLSEFLQPGAKFWFEGRDGEEAWEICDVGEIVCLSSTENEGTPHSDEAADSSEVRS